ncbi:MAG: CusA/CzcA family heavy metal efflux RND transporter [Kiritimatiellia bacterium]
MKRFFRILLAHPKIVVAGAILLAALGWRVGTHLAVDVFPEIREPRVVIQVEAGGLTAEEVEQRVVIPLEAAMNGIPGVRNVRSSSSGGLGFVWVDFDWNEDISLARFGVFERLQSVREQLPEEVNIELAPVVSVTGEIMLVALTCPSHAMTMEELRELAEYDLRIRLLGVGGIGDVVVVGGHLPEYQVRVLPERLAQYDLTLADAVEAVQSSRTLASAGYLGDVAGEEIPLRQIARADSLEALQRVKFPALGESPVRLGDVADVRLGGAPRRGSASFAGEEAVVLSVQKAPGANTPELTRKLDAVLDTFAAAHQADGIEVHREAYRQADFINLSIDAGRDIIRDAVIIVVLVLGLTLLRLRTILITLVTMPLSVLGGILLFPSFGLGINVMTLGGLAVGIGDIVDSAIIFVEIISRRLSENATRPESERRPSVPVIADAACEVLPSVLFSTVIIILVFVPLLMLTGLESRFFAPLAQAYLLVFGASFVTAVAVVPALSLLLSGFAVRRGGKAAKAKPAGESAVTRAMKAAYRPALALALRFPGALCAIMALLLAGSVYLASGFGASFIQSFHEDAFTVFVSTPPGTSLAETERISDNAAAMIRGIPGVESVLRRTGRAERDQHAEPPSTSELTVRVDMRADANRIRDQIRARLSDLPGVSSMVGYPIAHRISAALSGTAAEVSVSIFGEDLAVLRDLVGRVKARLAELPVVADVQANREILVTTCRIDYDLEALAEADLTLASAGEQVAAAFNGRTVATIRSGHKVRDLVVRLDPEGRALTPDDVRTLMLRSPTGKLRRLEEVAHVYREEAPNLIVREQSRRKALVTCNAASGVDTGTLVATLRREIDPIVLAAGCTVSYGGSYEARQSAGRRLLLLGLGLVATIFVLMTMALKSSRSALLVMVNIPLSLMGGVLAVQLTDPVLSVASLVGFVTVGGFVLRNGLLLLGRYRELEEQGADARTAIVEGSCERLVPILMTSLTTILGLVPIVLAADEPGGELLAPLAIVQFGGLISATLLNMLVLPALALLASRTRGRKTMPLAATLLLLSLAGAGCRSYAPHPIDFRAETTAWQATTNALRLASWQELETLALVANPEINALRLQARRSEAEAEDVGWWEDPELNVDFLRVLKADDYPNIFGASAAFTVPLSGVPGLEAKAAAAYAEADALAVRAAEQRLRTEVRLAAVRYEAARRRLELAQAYADDAKVRRALDQVERLAEAGELAAGERATIRRRWHECGHARIQAERAVEESRLTLNRLLGVMPSVVLTLPEDIWQTNRTAATIALPLELADHLRVRAACARLAGEELSLQAEIRRQYPSLSIGPAYSREDGFDRIGFVAGLTLPLWNRNRLGIAKAETSRERARLEAMQVWRDLVAESAATAGRFRKLAEHEPPEGHAQETADRLFALGELDPVSYLSVREEILTAKTEELAWREDYQLACLELDYYTIEQ